MCIFFFFQAEDGIRDYKVTGVQTCALPISPIADAEMPAHTGNVGVTACGSVVATVVARRSGATDKNCEFGRRRLANVFQDSGARQRRSRIWPVVWLLYSVIERVR